MRFATRAWHLGNVMALVIVLLSARIVYWIMIRGAEIQPAATSVTAAETWLDALRRERRTTTEAIRALSGESAFDQLPQPVLQRTVDLLRSITRGDILDRHGRRLAFDQPVDQGLALRFYTEPSLAHVIGYVSGLRAGITGLELTYNDSLLGLDRLDVYFSRSLHHSVQGSDLVLTIDSGLQRAADAALAGRPGAIVVLDGHSGAILAMVSQPAFDPNRILDEAYMQGLLTGCAGIPACEGALVNRAAQGLYVPGSTFKTVTLIAALDTGQVTPATVFDFGQPVAGPDGPYYVYQVGGGVIPDPNHAEAQLNLEMSYAKSANAAFARIGDEMPADILIEYAARFGFSAPSRRTQPFELPAAAPQLARDVRSLYADDWLRASTAIGQGELLVHPLAMAEVVLAVVNQGNLPLPYLVESVRHPQGETLALQPARGQVAGLMKPETAALVRSMMITTAEQGSGRPALVEGLTVGGKTGTAQVGADQLPHAWFIGFAEDGDRSVVISIVVENAGEGHAVAAPLFAQLADAALRRLGEAVVEVIAPDQTQDTNAEAASAPDVPPPDIPREANRLDILAGSGACPDRYEGSAGTGTFDWPVAPAQRRVVGSAFAPRHPGLDLGASPGSPIFAADAGVVVFSSWSDLGYGNVIVVDHGNGFQTVYAHLSQLGINCGAVVAPGDVLGLAGATGNTSGPHLHFEIRVPDGWVDPAPLLPPP